MKNETKRLDYLDMARGLAIILVILGHIYPAGNLKVILTSFHVPLFFIISGMLIKHKNENDIKIKYRLKRLIVPYFLFCIINIIVRFKFEGLKYNLFLMCTGYGIGALWFLPALLIGEIVFILINTKIDNKTIKIILILIISTIPFIKFNIDNIIISTLLIVILRGFESVLFLAVGYISYSRIKEINLSNIVLSLIIIILSMLAIYNGQVDLYCLDFNNVLIYLFVSIIFSLVVLLIMKNINQNKILIYFGKNSLILMCTHQVIMLILQHIFNNQFNGYISGTIFFIVILLIELLIIEIINRYMPFMLGKFKKKKNVLAITD